MICGKEWRYITDSQKGRKVRNDSKKAARKKNIVEKKKESAMI